MDDFKTVEVSEKKPDTLRALQKKDLAEMRESLLACSQEGIDVVTQIQKITAIRVHHQMIRIIRYLDMMDRIEDKLYDCIDVALENVETDNFAALLGIQARLQQSMIDSHKLLEPYLSIEAFEYLSQPAAVEVESNAQIMDRQSRDRLRASAQEVLTMLKPVEEAPDA